MNFVFAGVPLLIAGVIGAALAALVFMHGPGRVVNRCLATLLLAKAAVASAAAIAAFATADSTTFLTSAGANFQNSMIALMALPAIPLALSWPQRREWVQWPFASLWPFASVGLLYAFAFVAFAEGRTGAPRSLLSADGGLLILGRSFRLLAWGAATLLVVGARRAQSPALRDGHVLMALGVGGLAVYGPARDVAELYAYLIRLGETGTIGWITIVEAPLGLAAAGVFAWHLWKVREGRAARLGRGLMVLALLSGLADALLWYAKNMWQVPWAPGYELRLFIYAFWLLVPAALLAYVVLKGQIPGLDVKVRFAISKSTVAATFIMVFFASSEGAQIVFGRNDPWMGLVASSALVFAFAPLQRAADRLAERAIPSTGVAGPRETSYRKAVRLAMRDASLSRDDEMQLHELARDLGLDGARAHAIIAEIEREVAE